MIQITKKELVKGMSAANRKLVSALCDNVDVHCLVVLQADEGARRKMLSVGPTLDYPDLESVRSAEIDGMTVSAYVDCRGREHLGAKLFGSKSVSRMQALEDDLSEAKQKYQGAIVRSAELSSEVLQMEGEVAALREELEAHAKSQGRSADLEQRIELLDLREAELTRMEEALLTRMDQHMQKSAELEQWEEDLFRRERVLSSKAM